MVISKIDCVYLPIMELDQSSTVKAELKRATGKVFYLFYFILLFYFLKILILSNLYTWHGVQIYNPEIKSHMFH